MKHLIILLLSVTVFFGVYYVYLVRRDYMFQTNRHLLIQEPLNRYIVGMPANAILPTELSPGIVHWFNYDRDKKLRPVLDFAELYGVRLNPPTMTIIVDGQVVLDAIGFVGSPGLDGKVSYDSKKNSLVKYDPTNGSFSEGDLIVLFEE